MVIYIPYTSIMPKFTKLSTAQLKLAFETVLDKSSIIGLVGTRIHGVCCLSNGNVQVCTHYAEQAALLLEHSENWVPLVLGGASVTHNHFMLTTTSVPTAFDPAAPNTCEVVLH